MSIEIPLYADEELRFDRIIVYPYPDLKRIWARCWLTAVQDETPNLEIRVLNPDGTENASVYLMAQTDQRVETTLHLRDAIPHATYRIIAELTVGVSDSPELRDTQEFDLTLEFRNPETMEPVGMGVDWDELRGNMGS